MTSITPFGQNGPYAQFKASDIVVQAMGVLLCQAGYPDRAPVRTAFPQAYLHAAADAAEATMMALYHRGRTNEGQHIDVSAMESVLWTAGPCPFGIMPRFSRNDPPISSPRPGNTPRAFGNA